MKKFFSMILLLATLLAFTNCSGNDDEPIPVKEEVTVTLDYSFLEQGSMSRSAEDAYMSFYNEFVKTKQLAPKNCSLSFSQNNDIKATANGPWSGVSVRLKEGDYEIQGNTYPTKSLDDNNCISDSLYLSFSETVNISKTTESLNLSAKYDCFLLLFDANTIKSITPSFAEKHTLPKAGNLYYLFVERATYSTAHSTAYLSLNIQRNDGTTEYVKIGGLGLEKGKYYYFNDITKSFNIEPMENGDQ